jgi:superfamily II DNA helicase RecQ
MAANWQANWLPVGACDGPPWSGIIPAALQKAIAVASVLYVSPEMALGSHRFLFQDRAFRKRIIAVAVDEAHCVLHWGREFRTLYGGLFRLRLLMGLFIRGLLSAPPSPLPSKVR